MSFSLRVVQSVNEGTTTVSNTSDVACQAVVKLEEAVLTSDAARQIVVGLDVSALKVFSIVSDKAMTVQAYDASDVQVGTDLALAANSLIVWQEGDTSLDILAGNDVSYLTVSAAPAEDAVLKVLAGLDS